MATENLSEAETMLSSKSWSGLALALTVLVSILALPGPLEAQQRRGETDWWRWALAEVLVGRDLGTSRGGVVHFDPDARGRAARGGRFGGREGGGGPRFCRTGAGHPVFGRAWCVDKGFGLGGVRWRRDVGGLGDIIFRRSPRRDARILDRSGIEEILGEVLLGRLLERSTAGRRGAPVTGRWLEPGDREVRVLQLRVGDRPLAELTDLDRDAVVDAVLLADVEAAARAREERRGPPR